MIISSPVEKLQVTKQSKTRLLVAIEIDGQLSCACLFAMAWITYDSFRELPGSHGEQLFGVRALPTMIWCCVRFIDADVAVCFDPQ